MLDESATLTITSTISLIKNPLISNITRLMFKGNKKRAFGNQVFNSQISHTQAGQPH